MIFCSQLDTYRNTLLKKQEEHIKTKPGYGKRTGQNSTSTEEIISAKGAISRTKSQSTIKSKLNEIERAEKSISDIQNLKKKVDAGCSSLVTQLFFDNERFYDFQDKCTLAGIDVPIYAGIMPILNS